MVFASFLIPWKVMMRCTDMILVCLWQGEYVPCTQLFSVRRTDNGYCCSFNSIKLNEQL